MCCKNKSRKTALSSPTSSTSPVFDNLCTLSPRTSISSQRSTRAPPAYFPDDIITQQQSSRPLFVDMIAPPPTRALYTSTSASSSRRIVSSLDPPGYYDGIFQRAREYEERNERKRKHSGRKTKFSSRQSSYSSQITIHPSGEMTLEPSSPTGRARYESLGSRSHTEHECEAHGHLERKMYGTKGIIAGIVFFPFGLFWTRCDCKIVCDRCGSVVEAHPARRSREVRRERREVAQRLAEKEKQLRL